MISSRVADSAQLAFLFADSFSISELPAKPAKPRRKRTPKPQVDHVDLTLPLFDANGDVAILFDHEEVAIEVGMLSYMDGFKAEDEEGGEQLEWTTEGIAELHSVLLEESLKVLGGRGNAKQKEEVLEWIFTDFIDVDESRGIEVPAKFVPFTFQMCCALEGMDYENIRIYLSARLLSQSTGEEDSGAKTMYVPFGAGDLHDIEAMGSR